MRWQEAAPGLERAKCVQAPMEPRAHAHADYIRASHRELTDNTSAHSVIGSHLFDFQMDGGDGDPDGINAVLFRSNDDHPRSRIISAARVERAVEMQTFLDICWDEGLSVMAYAPDEIIVIDFGDDEIGFGQTEGRHAKSLRGAYLNYHAALAARPIPDSQE